MYLKEGFVIFLDLETFVRFSKETYCSELCCLFLSQEIKFKFFSECSNVYYKLSWIKKCYIGYDFVLKTKSV